MTAVAAAAVPDEAELRRRVGRLSLEQKIRLLTGADFWALYAEPAAGLRRLVDVRRPGRGPRRVLGRAGQLGERAVRRRRWRPPGTPARVEAIGGLLAREARRKGVDVLLAPTVNLHRTPYAGRCFECFSEDPLLTAGSAPPTCGACSAPASA